MRDLLHNTTWVHHLGNPTALVLLTMVLNFLPLQPPAETIMEDLRIINQPQASVPPVHSIPAVLVAGHLEVHLAILVPALLHIHQRRLTRQPLRI